MSKSGCFVYERTQGDYKIKCTKKHLDSQIIEFVAQMYYRKFNFTISYRDLLKRLLIEDDLLIDTSIVYTIYDAHDEIIATGKMIRYSGSIVLPIEKEFNINLTELSTRMAPVGEIWEVARLSAQGKNSIAALKLLLKEGIYHCGKDDLIVACIDRRVLLRLRRLGIPFVELGEAKQYLGSLTCPAAYSIHDLSGKISYAELHKE
ncbi:MAG: hypothetical protein PHU36_08560 [Syntrophomonadaceae bacterium]|nr:hypothetical protein [Syntrophomonadaceae bacterium]